MSRCPQGVPLDTMQAFRTALREDRRETANRIVDDFAVCPCPDCRRDVRILRQMVDEHFAQPADVLEALDRR